MVCSSLLFSLSAACSSAGSPPELQQINTTDPSFPGIPGDEATYDYLFQYMPLANCGPINPEALGDRTELRIFQGDGISDQDVIRYLGGLRRYYDRYGIHMFTRHSVIRVPLDHALSLNSAVLVQEVRAQTGVDLSQSLSLTSEQTAMVGHAAFHNVIEFFNRYAIPTTKMINIVLLRQIVGSGADPGESQLMVHAVAGLGLSPALLASFPSTDPSAALYGWVGVQDFTPTAFIGVDVTDAVGVLPDVVISHEVGHCYGLAHDTTSGDLMTPAETTCVLSLNDAQLATVDDATKNLALLSGGAVAAVEDRATDIASVIRSMFPQPAASR
jgi:hypothetical protein